MVFKMICLRIVLMFVKATLGFSRTHDACTQPVHVIYHAQNNMQTQHVFKNTNLLIALAELDLNIEAYVPLRLPIERQQYM